MFSHSSGKIFIGEKWEGRVAGKGSQREETRLQLPAMLAYNMLGRFPKRSPPHRFSALLSPVLQQ